MHNIGRTVCVRRGGRSPRRARVRRASPQIRQGLAAYRAIGAELGRPYAPDLAGRGLWDSGAAWRRAARAGRGAWLRCTTWGPFVRGRTAPAHGGVAVAAAVTDMQAEAEACFQQALDVARHQQAKSWELRAAMSLSPPVAAAGQAGRSPRTAGTDLRLVHRGL